MARPRSAAAPSAGPRSSLAAGLPVRPRAVPGAAAARSRLGNHGCSLEVKPEAHLSQAHFDHRPTQSNPVLGVKHQEAATARPNQLATQSTFGHAELVPTIDRAVAG